MASTTVKKCDICEKNFPDKIFNLHQRLHTEDKFHLCKNVCGKVFTSKDGLFKHECDGDHKQFACDICNKTFSQRCSLADHKRIHTAEKPYECDLCEKTFTRRTTLAQHKRIHKGEKPYECDVCKKTFTWFSILANHKKIHTGEKPYECNICEKTFSISGNLARHKRIHTSEKPYSCDICLNSYSQSYQLSRHNKTAAHLNNMMESMNTGSSINPNHFVDCAENIKVEDIKEEINEEENVEDPLSIYQETENIYGCEDIKEKIKEEESVRDYVSNQQGIDGIRLFSCDICGEMFTERIVLMMHKDINHSQHIPQII